MYESFFGLHEKPFSLLPDPSFFYLSKIHREALTLVEYGLYNQSGFTVLTGEIGSGKTTLMRYLLDRLDQELTVGLISHTHQSLGQIMDWICVAFDLKVPAGDRIAQHQAFVDFLLAEYRRGKKVLLIIDEAQNLGLDKLEEIRLLSNINADKDLVFQLLLLGQPQLRQQLRAPELEQFIQRVSASYHLGRLNAEETFHYIRHRLKIAGGEKTIFTPDACHAVYHYSKGIPRIINLICETALVFSYGAGEKTISGKAIDEFVQSDASHLLFALDREKRTPPPDDRGIFSDPSEPDSEESDSHPVSEPTAASSRIATPITAVLGHKNPAQPIQSTLSATDAPPERPSEPSDQSPEEASRATDRPELGFSDENAPTSLNKAPEEEAEEDVSDLSIAELLEASRTRRGWGARFGTMVFGLLLGLALVAWYLYWPRPAVETAQTDHAREQGKVVAENTAPQALAPAITEPTPPPRIDAGSDTLEMPPPAGVLEQQPGTLGSTQDVMTLTSTSPLPSPPDQAPATPPNTQVGETPATARPAVPEAENKASAPHLGVPTDSPEPLDAMSELEPGMAALPVKVERLGSAHLRVEFSRQIQFKDGSTQLEPEALELLKQFAALLREHETVRIKITAHTDTRGSESRNQALSEQRAARIARVLAQAGIPESRLSHAGKGESQPKIGPDEERSGGAWINRRIEIDLVE